MSYNKDEEDERNTKGKDILCEVTAHKLKKTVMKHVKEAESDIASACAIFHKRHEQKTGKFITTINEFEQVTKTFSKLPKSEIDELIKEGREEDRKRNELLKEMRKGHIQQ
jgi:hypothetical protein